MANWRRHLLSSKESVAVILCYAVHTLCLSVFLTFESPVNENLSFAAFISTVILYFVLGLVAEMFIGRPRLIRVSLWIQWAAMIMATLQCALIVAHYYLGSNCTQICSFCSISFGTFNISSGSHTIWYVPLSWCPQ